MWKKHIHMHLIYERLDRAIACKDWPTIYLESMVMHESFSCSDHYPIILAIETLSRRKKNFSFQFQNFWCQYQQLDQIVVPQW